MTGDGPAARCPVPAAGGCLTGTVTEEQRRIARRTFLGVAAAGALVACSPNPTGGAASPETDPRANESAPPSSSATTSPPKAVAPTGSGAPATTAAPAATTAPVTTAVAAAPTAAVFVPNGPRTKQLVSLTFHANGDPTMASKLLDILAARGVRTTVFGVGSWLVENPKLVARMVAEGHEVANHTWSHQTMGRLDRGTIATEISRCADALTKLIGSPSPWFRPSGIEVPTAVILEEAGKVGYRTSVGYDVDSLDFQDPGAKAVVANVAASVKPGSIISVHFGHQNTVDAMPSLLDLLATKDLRPVTVGSLLA